MTTFFLNSSPKIPESHIFGPNLDIFVFSRNLQLDNFEGAKFKYDNSFFQILAQKYQNKAFLVPNLRIFILHQTLQSEKFEDVYFKYDNGFFEF